MEEQASLVQILELLAWDQETYMPSQAIEYRAKQSAMISGLLHEKKTSSSFGDILSTLKAQDNTQAVALERARKSYSRSLVVPKELVEDLSTSRSIATQSWAKAKENDDLSSFLPALKEVVKNIQAYARCFEGADHIYDNLLEEYDPGMRTSYLDTLFQQLEHSLVPYVQEQTAKKQSDPFEMFIPKESLTRINQPIIEALGFNMDSGRLDISTHPFTVGMSPNDVRLTTRNLETDFLGTISGTIHECGHGLYEQGLPRDLSHLGLCAAAGCGLHESQSRFYENIIGKSMAFYKWLSPIIYRESGLIIPAKRLYTAANVVRPSLLRIYADETTYNLHIIIRYQLEKALIEGDLAVDDLHDAWNEKYQKNLGITPQSAKEGMLQDIHWSSGLFGYFPSYTIGNLFSASLRFALEEKHPSIWNEIEKGEFSTVLTWLRTNVHCKGHTLSQEEIIRQAVGERDSVADLMAHFTERHNWE